MNLGKEEDKIHWKGKASEGVVMKLAACYINLAEKVVNEM